MMEHIECCLRYPSVWLQDRGSLAVRLISISQGEWGALRMANEESDLTQSAPMLEYVLRTRLPVFVSHEELLLLQEDLDESL
jgi:hypothetical protein